MAYLQIKSNNPNLSYILMKNPETGMSLRRYRQGTFFGWFSENAQTYNLYFKDGDDVISFKASDKEEFEYNDVRRYNSPLFIQGAVNEFLKHLTNSELHHLDVEGYNNEILINQLHIFNPKYIELIKRYYKDFNLTFEELSPKNYRISIKTNKSIRDLSNFAYILAMFYHCLTDFDTYVNEGEIERYVRILNNIDSPYFIRYVVKSRVIRSVKKFDLVKNELEKCSYQDITLTFGNTHDQRRDFILENISGNNEVLDIGCGDMRSYGIRLARNMSKNDTVYHGVDIDKEAIFKAHKRIGHNALDNWVLYDSLEEFIDSEPTQPLDIILSEVFEHIKLKDDTKIIKNILKNLNFNKIIITTPNKDFNKYYNFDEDQVRIEEHFFEMTKLEFQNYFNKLLSKEKGVNFEFYDIGDTVNGVTPTQGIIITKK